MDNIKADPWVAYNGKALLIDSVGDRTWRERDKAINAEVSQFEESISLLGVVQCGTTTGEHLSGAQGSKAGPALSGRSPRPIKMP